MNKSRTKIYVKVTPEKNEIVYSGLEFAEFIKYLSVPIKNLLLVKGDYWSDKQEHNFELLEGQELIEKLTKENVIGDFCFVDYSKADDAARLSGQQIAELLYMGHIFKPLNSPFFETLQNRFAYLAHDDGWYCKLFCRNLDDFIAVLWGKIGNDTVPPVPNSIQNQLLKLAAEGILIDLDEIHKEKMGLELKVYTVGDHTDMDFILNNFQQLKEMAVKVSILSCFEKQWCLS